ncbi:MAG: type II toxin-antitoxin system RelE/ParE family toxin, partial [Giesbergeria sp.]
NASEKRMLVNVGHAKSTYRHAAGQGARGKGHEARLDRGDFPIRALSRRRIKLQAGQASNPLSRYNGNLYVTLGIMSYQVKELLLDDGDSPFADWFGALDAVAAAKVSVAVSRMEQGNLSNVEWFRGIGEYKIDWGPGVRIYLAKDGLKIIILIGGGTKKRQQQDIDQAVVLWNDYKRRKASTRQGK